MKGVFFLKLAWDGIRKNKRLYVPYLFTGALMVMMFYILAYLIESPALSLMRGGSVLSTILPFGCMVIGVFSLLFLGYSSTFLVRQRYREFGLYSILGMEGRSLAVLLLWETIFGAGIALVAGLFCGILFAKAAELVLLNLLGAEISYALSIGWLAVRNTLLVFGGIYLLLLVRSLLRVRFTRPLALMQSNRVGEKVPRVNWFFALAGVVLLLIAYYLAVSIQEPMTAIFLFFLAVVLVIVGTYLLFIAGSVALCRLLQKNKAYYYQPAHFVSVSSMFYRMKRNGAGLASICILLTMVLVMLSATASLYFGEEDALQNRYPNGVNLKVWFEDTDSFTRNDLEQLVDTIAETSGQAVEGMRCVVAGGLFTEEGMLLEMENIADMSIMTYEYVGYLYVYDLSDYNQLMGDDTTLAANECLLYCTSLNFPWNEFSIEFGDTWHVVARPDRFPVDNDSLAMTIPSAYMVVPDLAAFAVPFTGLRNSYNECVVDCQWTFGYDADTAEQELEQTEMLAEALRSLQEDGVVRSYYVQSREAERAGFFDMYGCLFFLGIVLSVVFLTATVSIIYYKQLSEGFEDQARFAIMQKVGMTKENIRASIHTQMMTVFFVPLLLATLHLAFAYSFISKILTAFAFDNTLLYLCVNLGCVVLCGLFYTIVYKITSGVYYRIVSR